jgi:hypothetical protein
MDHKAGLPIRSEADGTDERVHTKICDGATPSQMATVDTDLNLHVESHGNNPAGDDTVQRLAENGSTSVDGIYDAVNNTDPANIGVVGQTRNAAAADSRQVERVTAKRGTTATDVVAMDVSLHDENGNNYTPANPLPVSISNEETGTPVDLHTETSDVTPGGSQTVDYTVPAGGPLTLKAIHVASAVSMKVLISIGASGGPTRRHTKFLTAACPNAVIEFNKNEVVAVGDIVRVVFENRDQQNSAGYVTLDGMLAS